MRKVIVYPLGISSIDIDMRLCGLGNYLQTLIFSRECKGLFRLRWNAYIASYHLLVQRVHIQRSAGLTDCSYIGGSHWHLLATEYTLGGYEGTPQENILMSLALLTFWCDTEYNA